MTASPTSAALVLDRTLPYIESWISYRLWRLQVPGAQVAIRYDGELAFTKAFGLADLSTKQPLETTHLFRVASHSKTFTATAVLRLVEKRMLRLDDEAGAHVPALADAGSPLAAVTVGELLTHSAGIIRDGIDADYWSSASPFPDDASLLAILLDDGAIADPQSTFKYTNIGYSLLGMIIASVTGVSYGQAMHDLVVSDLALSNTGSEWDRVRAAEFAAGHSGLQSGRVRRVLPHVDTQAMAAATGFYSTAEDMTTFASAHFDGDERLLTDRSKRLMRRPQWVADSRFTDSRYGYGMTIENYDGHQMVGHSGGYPGHITRTMWDPAEKLAISVLTNSIDGPAEELAAGILRLLDHARSVPDRLPLVEKAAESDRSNLESFTGRFAALWGVTDVAIVGDELLVIHPNGPNPVAAVDTLEIVDSDTARIATGNGYGSVGEHFVYHRDADGTIESVTMGGMTAWPIDVFRERVESEW